MKFKVIFSDNIILTYDLIDENIVYQWIEILNTRTINDFCPNNHYIGYASDEHIQSKINKLYSLADHINQYSPLKINKVEINKSNFTDALNKMHIHFPSLKNDEEYKHIWDSLSEYNDIIHWLESSIKNKTSRLFRITFDFNKSGVEFRTIPDEAYKFFDPHTLFGELKLHYTHVGRHAQELFINNDFVCPKEQFIPQRMFSASVRMYFTDDFYIDNARWNRFYNIRGKKFWGMDINDPKLAFGYIKIGKLSEININGINNDIPLTYLDRHNFRNKLINTKVLGWIIKGA